MPLTFGLGSDLSRGLGEPKSSPKRRKAKKVEGRRDPQITPDPLDPERKLLAGSRVDVGFLLLLEAQPCAGETNAEIVSGAWDFCEINRRYAAPREILARRPYACLEDEAAATLFRAWLREERAAWNLAVRDDPLLPKVLLPSDYEGRRAWQERVRAMTAAGEQMRTFRSTRTRPGLTLVAHPTYSPP